ncbi:hypothetical protein QYE76_066475 [Lolium multiflorum]|uniref:Transposase (putative) gypsy type domain-containing protein n=1 Tax=Lolium multiflorum TaxID=4521 RepID=A0AAD8SB29_LOLMU|nr:hypothetical protein QYE76_066475 [Lolium multiflorum]
MVITKALVERGFSFPPSDFFSEILKAYGLQPHNISPNSVLAISNHVTLCEGHLRVTPELPLFQYYFTVKKEKIRQTSELATCGSITFMLRPGRVYPHTDRHESARYWSGGFFYLKDVSDPASDKKLPEFKNSPASETPAWTQCPHLSESPQLTRAVRRICKLTEEGLSGKDLTMSWFTKRIQPLQHRDRLMFHYTGRDDPMRATKDNLSADAIDKRIRLLIKIPRELHVHVCNIDIHSNGSGTALEALEEGELGTLLRVPHSGNNDPEAASEAEVPEAPRLTKRKKAAPSSPAAKPKAPEAKPRIAKKKVKPSPASIPLLQKWRSRPRPHPLSDPKDVINVDDLPEDPIDKDTRKLHEDLRTHVLEQRQEIELLQSRDADNQKAIALLETRIKSFEGAGTYQRPQESSARGVASLVLATCKAYFPTMNFADVSRGIPKGTNMRALLAETQGYDRLFVGRVNHSLWYNKHGLPSGSLDAEDEDEEELEDDFAEEGSGSSGSRRRGLQR